MKNDQTRDVSACFFLPSLDWAWTDADLKLPVGRVSVCLCGRVWVCAGQGLGSRDCSTTSTLRHENSTSSLSTVIDARKAGNSAWTRPGKAIQTGKYRKWREGCFSYGGVHGQNVFYSSPSLSFHYCTRSWHPHLEIRSDESSLIIMPIRYYMSFVKSLVTWGLATLGE